MKKILISCIILFAAVSSSYAKDPYSYVNYTSNSLNIELGGDEATAVAEINATTELNFSCTFYTPSGSGEAILWDSEHAGYLDSYVYCPNWNWIGTDDPNHLFTMTDYFSTVTLYVYGSIIPFCEGYASLSW